MLGNNVWAWKDGLAVRSASRGLVCSQHPQWAAETASNSSSKGSDLLWSSLSSMYACVHTDTHIHTHKIQSVLKRDMIYVLVSQKSYH